MIQKREYGLDLLRILSMFGILGLHILSAGQGLETSDTGSLTFYLLQVLHIICLCSVNLFAMITGYLYIDKKKIKSANLVNLLVIIFAYSLVFTILLYFLSSNFLVDAKSILSSLFPMATGAYWYMVCYVFLFSFLPWINLLLSSLPQKQFQALWLLMAVFCCIIPTLFGRDYFAVLGGYSPIWIIFCYLTGAYLKKYKNTLKLAKSLQVCFIVFCINVIFTVSIYALGLYSSLFSSIFERLLQYNSPIMVANAILLFLCFINFNFENSNMQRIILSLSDAAFEVYAVHCHNYFFEVFIRCNFDFLCMLSPIVAVIAFLLSILAFYILGWIALFFRKKAFSLLRIDHLIQHVGNKIDILSAELWHTSSIKS